MDLQMCRICGGAKELKNILEEDKKMINKLVICANINIPPGDILPKLICVQCERNLDISYRLRKQSEATEKRLRIEIQRKQRVLSAPAKEILFTSNTEGVSEHSDCGNFDLYQYSEDSNGSETMGVTKIKRNQCNFIYPQQKLKFKIPDKEKKNFKNHNIMSPTSVANEVGYEKKNDVSNTRSNFVINTSEDDCGNTLKKIAEVSIVSENCSIDSMSSSGSPVYQSVCSDDLKNEHVKDILPGKNAFKCDTCHEVLTTKNDYSMHIKQHGVERYQCIQCCKFFPSRFRLKRHEQIHNEVLSHQCFYCNRNYRSLYNLKRHIRSAHLGKKSWECNVCNITFSRVDVLKRHLQLHSEEKKFRCLMCSQSFKTKDYLCAHHKAHHTLKSELPKNNKRKKKDSANINQCGYCGKLFKSSFSYKNHLLIHTNEKPYKCDSCNKNFRTIAALTTHQRIHDDYRPYQCNFCLKSFRQMAHLKEHKSLHLNNVPKHFCSICQSSFAKKWNLKAHIRIHSKEKPFKCADCSAEFNYMYLLQRHANKIHYRSVHKVYTLNDVGEIVGTDSEVHNNGSLETEMYHYIDTVADDEDELDTTVHFVDLIENNENIPDTSSPILQVITKASIEQNNFDDNNCIVPDSYKIIDYIEMNSLNLIQSPYDGDHNETNIKEHKLDLLVTEETKLTIGKLEKILKGIETSPGVSEEWGSGWKGTNFILEIEETASIFPANSNNINSREEIFSTEKTNTTNMVTQGPKIIVRTEEILIVGLVLMLWVGAIILFFNRWGKIRMLEPYQPKFQQHRASCPLSDIDTIPHQRSSISRMSMGFVNNVNMPSCQFAAYNPTIYSKGYLAHSRPRQNSVFVGPSPNQFLMPKPPRKTRSAIDLHSMILYETAEQV